MPRPARPSPVRRAAIAAALCVPAAAIAQPRAAADAPFRVGPLLVRAGESATGAIPVPAGVDSGTQVPVSVIRGRRPGPVLALVAGTHGSEVAPVVALQRVRARLDAPNARDSLRGTVVLVHVANLPSFQARTVYYSPVDGKNLNRVYPGRPDGTVSERIAHAITTEVIDRADYLVDLHAGDGNESLRPYTYWSRLGLDPKVDSAARELALAWGADHIVVDDDRPRDRARTLYTQNTAQVRGKPSITTETGWLGVPDPEMVRRNEEGAFRLLRHLGMLPGAAERVARPVWLVRTSVLTSPATGTWHAAVERGHTVAEGTVVGTVTDFAGRPLAEVRAPFAGEVLYVIGTPAMRAGEPVAMLGQAGDPDAPRRTSAGAPAQPALGPAEAVSLLGDTLRRPALPPDARARLEAQLDSSRQALAADPASADAAIWVARRLGYLGRYREAVAALDTAIARHPADARLYRHRGHRFITLRRFDRAAADLERAAALVRGRPDEVEPDGQPNARGVPVGTLQSNVWYHLALARYLQGDWRRAADAAREGMRFTDAPDRLVSQAYWLYLALARQGRPDEARRVLARVRPGLDVIENGSYYALLRLYQGDSAAAAALPAAWARPAAAAPTAAPGAAALASPTDLAAAYGVTMWHALAGRAAEAAAVRRSILASGQWASFGYVAAEADAARAAGAARGESPN